MRRKRIYAFFALVVLGILFRTSWHIGNNVEFVTTSTLLAGSYLGLGWAIFIPVVIMFLSDLILGNTSIFIFTWSAYMLIGAFSYFGFSAVRQSSTSIKIVTASSFAISASLWFYLWTNFGVWLLDSWGMYPKTFVGLIDAYILALPFLKMNLIGNLMFVPVSFFIAEKIKSFSPIFDLIHPIFHPKTLKNSKF